MEADLKEFTKLFNQLAHKHSYADVFTDFLDIVIYALANQQYEAEYIQLISKYNNQEQNQFANLFAEMILVMDNKGNGFADCLGEFFMIHITAALKYGRIAGTKQKGQNGYVFSLPECKVAS